MNIWKSGGMKAALCPLLVSPNPAVSNSPRDQPPSPYFPTEIVRVSLLTPTRNEYLFPLFLSSPRKEDFNRGTFRIQSLTRFLRQCSNWLYEKVSRLILRCFFSSRVWTKDEFFVGRISSIYTGHFVIFQSTWKFWIFLGEKRKQNDWT